MNPHEHFKTVRAGIRFLAMCSISVLLSTAVVGRAAEISVVTSADDEQNVLAADRIPYITIDGTIVAGDFQKLVSLSSTLIDSGHPLRIVLNSNGGDAVEAMKMGRFVRSTLAEVIVTGAFMTPSSEQPLRKCYSACVLVLLGAPKRDIVRDHDFFNDDGSSVWETIDGVRRFKEVPVIGVHRPHYLGSEYANLSPEEAAAQYSVLELTVRRYLAEMGAPDSFSDQMFRHASNRIHLVSKASFLEQFGYEEPFLEEWFIARCGGLTKQEVENGADIYAGRILRQDQSFLPTGITAEYAGYLATKAERIRICKNSALRDHQQSSIQALRESQRKD